MGENGPENDPQNGPQNEPLLASLRVLDLCDGEADTITRLPPTWGADVLKVELPGGNRGRSEAPSLGAVSIPFALHNANKRLIALDPDDEVDRHRLIELAAAADIVVDSGLPGRAVSYGTSCEQLADRFRHLVAMLVTDFGSTGPYASWRATDPVFYAMCSALSRSGPTVGTPVLPPEGIASATAAVPGRLGALGRLLQPVALRCGRLHRLRPIRRRGDGARSAVRYPGPGGDSPLCRRAVAGRPRNQDLYPIFKCRDGFVRLCVLAPRQWHGLRAWLGEPERFQDPRFDGLAARAKAFDDLGDLIGALFADRTRAQLVSEGQNHGVPIASVLTPSEALHSTHLTAVGALADAELAPGVGTRVPVGYWSVDGARAGFRATGTADEAVWRTSRFDPEPTAPVGAGRWTASGSSTWASSSPEVN